MKLPAEVLLGLVVSTALAVDPATWTDKFSKVFVNGSSWTYNQVPALWPK